MKKGILIRLISAICALGVCAGSALLALLLAPDKELDRRANVAADQVHNLKRSLTNEDTRVLSVSLPDEISPSNIAIRINGVYSLPYMGGDIWRPTHPLHPKTFNYKLLILIDKSVREGQIILLDRQESITFTIDSSSTGYWWVVQVALDPETSRLKVASGEQTGGLL